MEPEIDLDAGHGAGVRRRLAGINVPPAERIASIALGAAAIAAGLRRRSIGGLVLALAGAPLVVRGVLGRCGVYRQLAQREGVEIQRSITIDRPRGEVYAVWRALDNIPRFLDHVQQVVVEDDTISHWLVTDGSVSLEWIAEIVEDVPDQRIAWHSVPGSDVDSEGIVDLLDAADGSGTEVHLTMRYRPPAGLPVAPALASALQRLAGADIEGDLEPLRRLLETGDAGAGRARRRSRKPRGTGTGSAQTVAEAEAVSAIDRAAPTTRGEV
jgi:uncharacterized membrane protein